MPTQANEEHRKTKKNRKQTNVRNNIHENIMHWMCYWINAHTRAHTHKIIKPISDAKFKLKAWHKNADKKGKL